MKVRAKYSIKSRIIGIIMLCWCIPVLLMLGAVGYYIFSNHFENEASAQMEQLTFNNKICVERLNSLIKASKQVTYDKEIEKIFSEYTKGHINQRGLLDASSSYLWALAC